MSHCVSVAWPTLKINSSVLFCCVLAWMRCYTLYLSYHPYHRKRIIYQCVLFSVGMTGSRLWSSTLTRPTSSTCGGRRCCRTQKTKGRKKGSKRYGEGGKGWSVAFKESANVYWTGCLVCTIKDDFINSFIHLVNFISQFILVRVMESQHCRTPYPLAFVRSFTFS